ncbi:transmembrane prolyl 4-hydroxylase-like [Actinia tenebrosa]|uniref:Transmembrane prolyl 4-hydroxylase-like n=1 Tax=Actinia tenebrosa TaxID=6105 RepID=A0A6P8HUQ2_ACTTE|nr:transmembrane prolyl 4-hydroxylase-like [Actinia tenebrosa]
MLYSTTWFLGVISLVMHLSNIVVAAEVNTVDDDVCQSNDVDCYFRRYSNLTLHRINPVKVGHVRHLELEPGKTYQMKTLAVKPPIFEISDFLSDAECDHIIYMAQNQGLETSSTVRDSSELDIKNLGENTEDEFKEWDCDGNGQIDMDEMLKTLDVQVGFSPDRQTVLDMYANTGLDQDQNGVISLEEFLKLNTTAIAVFIRHVKQEQPHTKGRHSEQTWLGEESAQDPVLKSIQRRVQRLTQLPTELVQASEYLQVVSYGPRGHYNCHLDSDFPSRDLECCHLLGVDLSRCRICRYLTVLYFLNDVEEGGETAFPLADNSTFDEKVWMRDEKNLCNLAKNCYSSNVVAKPSKGKAIMWYNHVIYEPTRWMGTVDHYSFHGGCDVRKGRKWIANSWIGVSNERQSDILNWIELARTLADKRKDNKKDEL